jgi:HSP20 family molecular chaperone IbpA
MKTLTVNVAGIDPSTIKVNYVDGYVNVKAVHNGIELSNNFYIGAASVTAEVKYGLLTITPISNKKEIPVTIK